MASENGKEKSGYASKGYVRYFKTTWCCFPLISESYSVCPHSCVYCYANNGKRALNRSPVPKPYKWQDIIKDWWKRQSDWWVREWPINALTLGINTDAFPPEELKYRNTEKVLTALVDQGIYFKITSKGIPRASRKCWELAKELGQIETSISTFNDHYADKTEPYASPPSERIAVLGKMAKDGVPVNLRLQPWLFGSEYSQLDIDELKKLHDQGLTRVSLSPLHACYVNKHKEQVLWEINRTSRSTYYQKFSRTDKPQASKQGAPQFGYSYAKIRPFLEEMSSTIRGLGFKFGLCDPESAYPNYDLYDGPYGCHTRDDMPVCEAQPEWVLMNRGVEEFQKEFIVEKLLQPMSQQFKISAMSNPNLLPKKFLDQYGLSEYDNPIRMPNR